MNSNESQTALFFRKTPRAAAHFSTVAASSGLVICFMLALVLLLHSCSREAHAEAKPTTTATK